MKLARLHVSKGSFKAAAAIEVQFELTDRAVDDRQLNGEDAITARNLFHTSERLVAVPAPRARVDVHTCKRGAGLIDAATRECDSQRVRHGRRREAWPRGNQFAIGGLRQLRRRGSQRSIGVALAAHLDRRNDRNLPSGPQQDPSEHGSSGPEHEFRRHECNPYLHCGSRRIRAQPERQNQTGAPIPPTTIGIEPLSQHRQPALQTALNRRYRFAVSRCDLARC